jgi:hypothetical protein
LKATGPAKTIAAAKAGFDETLASVAPQVADPRLVRIGGGWRAWGVSASCGRVPRPAKPARQTCRIGFLREEGCA